MKKTIKRVIALLLVAVMVFPVVDYNLFHDAIAAENNYLAEYEAIKARIEELKAIYDGKSWNANKNNNDKQSEEDLKKAINANNLSFGLTDDPCECKIGDCSNTNGDHHNRTNGCTSNSFGGGRQCNGFAKYFAYVLFGTETNTWTKYTNITKEILKPGDYVSTGKHAYIVWKTDLEKNELYVAECNYGDSSGRWCQIRIGKSWNSLSVECSDIDFILRSPTRNLRIPPDKYISEMNSKKQTASATGTVTTKSTGNPAKIYEEPYDTGNEKVVVEVKKGEKVTINGWLENEHGNIWYRVNYNGKEGWMYQNWVTNVKENAPTSNIEYYLGYVSSRNKGTQIELDGYEKYNHSTKSNKSISVRGTVNSPGRKILTVRARISEITESGELLNHQNTQCTPGAYSVDLASTIDNDLHFNELEAGKYVFSIICELEKSKLPGSGRLQWAKNLFNFYIAESCTFTVYDENTSAAEKSANIKAMANISKNYTVSLADNTFEPVLIKNSVNYVEPPAVSVTPSPVTPSPSATKTYKSGVYRTTSSNTLNVRTGPGSSYAKATTAIPKGTEINVTEVSSNGWGKIIHNGVTGWVSLNYCTYLRPFDEIQKPEKVSVKYNSDADIAEGAIVNVSWNTVNYADTYNAYLKNSDGTVIKTLTGISDTSAYFTVDTAGKYYISVSAVNSKYIGDESASPAFNVHAPCKVDFVDWNGRTETRKVKYGESATAPLPPVREGYTFMGWDKSFDKVTADITVNAIYKIKTYTVKFIKTDEQGKTVILKSEPVEYGKSATPPTDTQNPEFCSFVGWNSSDYECVKENLTIKAVYKWTNTNLPVGISAVSATRVNGGYTVKFSISCTEASVINGRAIVSFKTTAGKQIVTTESAAFSLASGTTNKSMGIFVPTDKPATVAEVYVVESFGTAIPQSEVASCAVVMNDEWSGWTDDKWPDNTYDEVDTRTMYRYQTKSETTSTSKTLSGWTHYNTTSTSSKGSSYSYVAPVNTEAHVRSVSTTTENVYSTYYRYHHYTNGGYNVNTRRNANWACSPWYGNTDDGCGPTNIGPHYYESATRLTSQTVPMWNIKEYKATCSHTVNNARYSGQRCLNTWFFNETPFQKVTGSRIKYNYTDTYYTYYFYKWSNWSSWTETEQTQSDNKNVQEKTQYRYKMNNLGIEDNSGIERVASTVSAGLSPNDIILPNLRKYAGNAVTLYIYKHNEASDWTGEYIGQQTIDENGDYSFEFVLREEPSVETGDYMVSIGIEGCTETINVGRIIAPKPEYKVVFKYYQVPSDNSSELITLDSQIIAEGDAVAAPQHIEFEGYKFLGWNTDLSYVTEDTMFVEYGEDTEEKIITYTARYEPEEYAVVFIDWENEFIELKRYKHGESIVAPIITAAEGYEAVWEGFDAESSVVTGDTVIVAKHTKKIYEVNFYDYDGNVINTQSVEYGSTASDVSLDEKENYIFLDWEYTESLFDNAIIDGGMIYAEDPIINFYPVYIFDETVENPVSSLSDGTYDSAQIIELSTETEGALIYYTLDGTDPQTAVNGDGSEGKVYEYSEPFVLDTSAILKYYACSFEMNDSEVMTNYYAINAGNAESEKCLVKIVPDYSDFGTETLTYIAEVNGYLGIDEEDYAYGGYDFIGFFTDSEFTKEFDYKTTPVSGDMTIYPKYKAHEFNVVFKDYDGKVLIEETVKYGEQAYGPDEIERNGYVFTGWDTDALGFVTEDVVATAQYVSEDMYCKVYLDYDKYTMISGSSYQFNATVAPQDAENTNLIWYTSDESVVTVSDEGYVTAVGDGVATIVVETEATGFTDECVITVSSNPAKELCLNYSSELKIDKENSLIRGLTNSVWTVSELKKEFMNESRNMLFADINGNALADEDLVGTGTVVSFMNGEKVLDEISVVIAGDMNGDGYVNNRDASMISRYLVGKEKADFCQMVAIDVNGDGYVNNRDAAMVTRYLVGKETI